MSPKVPTHFKSPLPQSPLHPAPAPTVAALRHLAEILAPLQPPISPDHDIIPQVNLERSPQFPPALKNYILT